MTRVKICGLSTVEHAVFASEAGADFIGMVFAQSRRRVTLETAIEIVKAVKASESRVQTIGVFAGLAPEEINRIADECDLDRVQLSGGETWEFCAEIKHPIIKTVHVSADKTAESALSDIAEGLRLMPEKDVRFLLDTKIANSAGGTGQRFDWNVARQVSAKFPVIIAGGLDPANVLTLISEVHPWGVDVSSGVESRGVKNTAKIKAFIDAAKNARYHKESDEAERKCVP